MTLEKKVAQLEPLFRSAQSRFHHVATDDSLKWAQEKAFFLKHLQTNPKLQLCTSESLANAILEAGAMGLTMNPLKRFIYIIARRERKRGKTESWKDYEKKVPFIAYASPSYMGLVDSALRSGYVMQIAAEIVFKNDRFSYSGPFAMPRHESVTEAQYRKFIHASGCYAAAVLKHGGVQSTYLDSEEISRIRDMSEQPDAAMWNPQHLWTEGWKKATIRRLWKTLPRTDSMAAIESQMNTFEGVAHTVDDNPLSDVVKAEPITDDPLSPDQLAQLKTQLEQAGLEEVERNKWMNRLAIRCEVASGDATQIPANCFNLATELFTFGLKERAALIAKRQAEEKASD